MKQSLLVPTFSPPDSSAFFNSSFSKRTSQLLQLRCGENGRCRRVAHTSSASFGNNSHANPTSLSNKDGANCKIVFDVFDGCLSYEKCPKKKRNKAVVVRPSHVEEHRLKRKRMSTNPTYSTHVDEPDEGNYCKIFSKPSQPVSPHKYPTKGFVPTSTRFDISVEGIEEFCRNVGASSKALDAFEEICSKANSLSLSFIYLDGTTTHVATCLKYCVPSKPCSKWYCLCDRHIRARQAMTPLLGAAFCIEGEEAFVYFLSLTDKLNSMINCSTSLDERLQTLVNVLCADTRKVAIFNAQIGLMPLIHHLQSLSKTACFDKLMLEDALFDVKIAAHLCDTNLSDEELEFQAISSRCRAQAVYEVSIDAQGAVTKVLHRLHGELQCLLQMRNKLEADMKVKFLLRCFCGIEMPLAKVLSTMELNGFQISFSKLESIQKNMQICVDGLERKAERILLGTNIPMPFNMASPEQVAHVLFDVLKLNSEGANSAGCVVLVNSSTISELEGTSQRKKGGKHRSTSEEDLIHMKAQHPIVEVILAHRHASKVLQTFVKGIQPYIADDEIISPNALKSPLISSNRKVYASWNQTSTRTGRLSCQKPNLQAFPNPKRHQTVLCDDNADTNVRSIFTASFNSTLVSADYSQIEMRVLAHLCEDDAMISLFNTVEGDIYEILARIILNKEDIERISIIERERAKVICLGTIYGMGLPTIASKLGISLQEAQTIMSSFHKKFGNVKLWIQNVKREAKKRGYVSTVSGRKRFLPDICSTDPKKRSQAERQAVNSVIQGSASDIIKFAMLSVEKFLESHFSRYINSASNSDDGRDTMNNTFAQKYNFRPRIVSQIHDEVIYDVPLFESEKTGGLFACGDNSALHGFVHLLRDCLENITRRGLNIKVPLLIKIFVGEDWGNMSPFECTNTECCLHSAPLYRIPKEGLLPLTSVGMSNNEICNDVDGRDDMSLSLPDSTCDFQHSFKNKIDQEWHASHSSHHLQSTTSPLNTMESASRLYMSSHPCSDVKRSID